MDLPHLDPSSAERHHTIVSLANNVEDGIFGCFERLLTEITVSLSLESA
jgi:hypothetical protein